MHSFGFWGHGTDRQTDGRIAAVLNVSPYLRGIVMQLLRTLRVCVLQRHYSDPAFKDRSVGREDTFLTVPLLREYHFNVPVSLSSLSSVALLARSA